MNGGFNEMDPRVFGSGLAPRGGAGKFVATGATAALPALDGLDVTVLADIWIGTFGAGWPCVCHETPLSWSSTNGNKVKQPEQIFHTH